MSNVNKKFVFAFMAVVLICALIVPIVSVAPVAANPDVQVYFRVECPADEDTYRETGEYELIWAGYITVPTDVNITCKSGVEYHLYVNSSDRYVVERTSDGYTWDRGPADQNIGATSVLAALDEASTPENGNFTYEVLDTWFPGMGFFISAIDGHMGSGSVGWSYRVWNPDDAGLSPIAADSFLLGYNTMPIATPHEQVLWYWGGSGCGSPLRITSDKTAAGVGEEFTATVEYFRDYGHGPGGIWETLAGATIDVGSETFTTDDNGTAKIFLESTGTYELSARKGFDGNSYYVPSDDRTEVSVSGGDTSSWWTQTTQTDFSSGTPYQVNTSVSPGDVKLERGGTVTDDYILDGGTETLGGEYFYDNFTIKNGTTLYVADGESLIVHANHIYIDSSSKIDADGRGYDGGSGSTGNGDGGFGPGAGSRGVHSGVHGGGGSGAGYAGAGGCGSDGWSEKAAGGYKYGGTCQKGDHSFYLGSGGGGGGGDGSSNAGGDGGDGGGAVRLEANTIDIDGEITAAGEDGSDGIAAGCGGGGGGSGGTIYIAGSDINIANGALTVQGGDGGDGGGTNGHGGGGGSGGHIKVFYENVNDSSGHHGYYSSGGTGDPYNGRGGYCGSGVSYSQWKQERFSPTEPYYEEGTLTSSACDTTYSADFGKIHWCSATPSGTELKFQLATNSDNDTWDFRGPDGTGNTYYITSGSDIWSGHDGNRYIKYKAFLSTTEPGRTSTLSKVGITYTEQQGEVISFTVTDYGNDGIRFGNIDPGQIDQPADWGGSQGAVNLTVGAETNVNVNVQLKGTDFTGTGTISISNVKYDDDATLNEGTETGLAEGSLSGSYATWYSVPANTENITQVYYWISIPGGQVAGDYNSTFYYQAIKSG